MADPNRWRPPDSLRMVQGSMETLAFRDRPQEREQALDLVDRAHIALGHRDAVEAVEWHGRDQH